MGGRGKDGVGGRRGNELVKERERERVTKGLQDELAGHIKKR